MTTTTDNSVKETGIDQTIPCSSLSINRRNPGHWDIYMNNIGRAFRIRGGPGAYSVFDERSRYIDKNHKDDEPKKFKTVQAAIGYITDLLMYELIVVEGQTPATIESWNI